MTIVAIATNTTLPHWDQTTTLDGTDYILGFRYNLREAVYYLILADISGNILAGGIKLVCNVALLQGFVASNFPPGELAVTYNGNLDGPPALGELGIGCRCTLYYIPQADMQAAGIDPNRDPLALV